MALEYNFSIPEVLVNRGNAAFHQSKFDLAFLDYKRALEMEPGNATARAMMSQFRNGETVGARGGMQGQSGRAAGAAAVTAGAATAGAALRRRAGAAAGGAPTRGAWEPEEKTTKQIKAGLDSSVRSCYYFRPDISNKSWFDMKRSVMLKPDWEAAGDDEEGSASAK